MYISRLLSYAAICISFMLLVVSCNTAGSHYYDCRRGSDIDRFMSQDKVIISGHRGGNLPGYPENCIETFEKILDCMPTFYEIDPRMTRDSVIVLMHDETLDRTTTGTGRVSDYTFAELQRFNLVDRWGTVTPYRIPAVKDVVEWSRGKVILNFDIKDVTRDVLVPFVNSLGAENCIYTVRNAEEALQVYSIDPDARMSAWVKDVAQLQSYKDAGIPMENIALAYVCSSTMKAGSQDLYDALHAEGIPCMVSTAPDQDKAETEQERAALFRDVLGTSPDIVETDFPLEFVKLVE